MTKSPSWRLGFFCHFSLFFPTSISRLSKSSWCERSKEEQERSLVQHYQVRQLQRGPGPRRKSLLAGVCNPSARRHSHRRLPLLPCSAPSLPAAALVSSESPVFVRSSLTPSGLGGRSGALIAQPLDATRYQPQRRE